ncbi:MAG: adenylate/guanylate cyclase domain-containing protein [Candidatus Lambdaproteobacteria bacterium]|nr:adenylate/guanylate cyclase domain-containing protein [Candidatus Lambdaproteobacteria bacterium]
MLQRSAEFAEPFMVTASTLAVIGHPLFYVIWTYWIPQPYENLGLRALGSLVCLPLVFKNRWPAWLKPWLPWYWHFAVLFTLPFFFALFLFFNNFSQMWELTAITGIFLLTFFVHWMLAAAMIVVGTLAASVTYMLLGYSLHFSAPVAEIVIVYLFMLCVGGAINWRLQQFRAAQAAFEKRLRVLSGQNATMMREHSHLLGRFLNNIIINRLREFQEQYGLERALYLITRQEKRFCGIMQADIRNFTRMFDMDTELHVAQLISQCFSEITAIGQDLAVIKPVGDCIFMYSDEAQGKEAAVLNILSLASFFVHSVERINESLVAGHVQPLNFGIAVHAGDVIYGNLASDTMIDPTVIGLNVNKTARMEELTKSPAVHALVGNNAVIMSEEFYAFVRAAHGDIAGVQELPLNTLNVSIRDFPTVHRVYALPSAAAVALYPLASERIRGSRLTHAPHFDAMERSAHLGVEYFFEMHGAGPRTTWSVHVNVTGMPEANVTQALQAHVQHGARHVSQGQERWLTLSTEEYPGEYDQTDIEDWVLDIIQRLRPVN